MPATGKLLDYGPLGILCALLITALGAVVTSLVYLYKRQNTMGAEESQRREEASEECERQREALRKELGDSQKNYTEKLTVISTDFGRLVSGNVQAMDGMRDNLMRVSETMERGFASLKQPRKKK